MTEKIEELLAKLKELDPETWNCYQHRLAPLRDTPCDARRGKIITLAILQGVILDAITSPKRKWRIGTAVSYPEDYPTHWQIDVWLDHDHCYWGSGKSYAEALLAAYILALEAGR